MASESSAIISAPIPLGSLKITLKHTRKVGPGKGAYFTFDYSYCSRCLVGV